MENIQVLGAMNPDAPFKVVLKGKNKQGIDLTGFQCELETESEAMECAHSFVNNGLTVSVFRRKEQEIS